MLPQILDLRISFSLSVSLVSIQVSLIHCHTRALGGASNHVRSRMGVRRGVRNLLCSRPYARGEHTSIARVGMSWQWMTDAKIMNRFLVEKDWQEDEQQGLVFVDSIEKTYASPPQPPISEGSLTSSSFKHKSARECLSLLEQLEQTRNVCRRST